MIRKSLLILVLLILSLGAAACGGGMGGGGGGDGLPVQEVKDIRARLNGQWTTLQSTLDGLKSDAGSLGLIPDDVDTSALDIDAIKAQFMDCLNTPVQVMEDTQAAGEQAVDQAGSGENREASTTANEGIAGVEAGFAKLQSCPGASMDSATDAAGAAPDVGMAFVTSKVNQVDRIRKAIFLIPTQAELLVTTATEIALNDLPALAAETATMLEVALSNPLNSAAEKQKYQQQYDEIMAEIDAIKGLAETITNEATGLPRDAAQIADQVKTDLANFGQRPGT